MCPDGTCRRGDRATCVAVTHSHTRICDLTDPSHPAYNPTYLGARAAPAPADAAPRPAPAAALALIRAVSRCPVRQADGCGCGGKALCFRAGSPRRVYPDECRDCRAAAGPA